MTWKYITDMERPEHEHGMDTDFIHNNEISQNISYETLPNMKCLGINRLENGIVWKKHNKFILKLKKRHPHSIF